MAGKKIIISLDKDLRLTYVNQVSEIIWGLTPVECLGLSIFEFIPSEDIPATKQRIASWQENKLDSVLFECRQISRRGEIHKLIWNINLERDEHNNIVELSGVGHQSLDWKQIHDEWLIATMIFESSNEAMIVLDENLLIINVNPAFEKITGYLKKEVLSKHSTELLINIDRQNRTFYDVMRQKVLDTGNWRGELWCKKKNGEPFAAQLIVNTLFYENKTPHRRLLILSDITENKPSEELIWQQLHTDSLTGLFNRNFLKQEIVRAQKTNQPVALLFLDLDDFKYVNDTLGQDMGDSILIETAKRLEACNQKMGSIIRLGGDEFAILLTENIITEHVERLAHCILKNLSQPYHIGSETIHLSTSIGIAFYPEDNADIENLMINADQAMYAAKRNGKNQFHYFMQSMQDAAKSRMQIINDLRLALNRKQFQIMYQPIVELNTGIIHKAEALIRWEHPTKGLINPIDFIFIAEDTGMINAFGNWVFHEAAKQVSIWREKYYPDFQIDINISPVQFRNEGINSIEWLQHLETLNLPGSGIGIEITERLLLEASDQVKEQLLTLREAGISIALDDFGVGYSSLSYLQKFHIDYIKIDRAFLENLSKESDNLILCEAIIVMAHKLGMKVIAEGIETPDQQELLVSVGCDYGQGYLYSRALPADQFEQLLKQKNVQS